MTSRAPVSLTLARARIVAALAEADGNVVHAAEALGVSHRTLCRWVAALRLESALDASRDEQARSVGRRVRRARRQG